MASKLQELLVTAVLPVVKSLAVEELSKLLVKVKPLETQKTILLALYPILDVELERLTKESKTKVDDTFIDAFKEAIESAAAASGITLENPDND